MEEGKSGLTHLDKVCLGPGQALEKVGEAQLVLGVIVKLRGGADQTHVDTDHLNAHPLSGKCLVLQCCSSLQTANGRADAI